MNHYERIDRKPQATIGQVVAVGSGIDTMDKRELKKVKQILPFGITSYPIEGETVILLPLENGEQVILGRVWDSPKTNEEVFIQAKSGAYICLKKNGDVEINNLRIRPDGQIEHN